MAASPPRNDAALLLIKRQKMGWKLQLLSFFLCQILCSFAWTCKELWNGCWKIVTIHIYFWMEPDYKRGQRIIGYLFSSKCLKFLEFLLKNDIASMKTSYSDVTKIARLHKQPAFCMNFKIDVNQIQMLSRPRYLSCGCEKWSVFW